MSTREDHKQRNRERILAAAASLVREGGLEALAMRPLAERAGLSSRTPYNLFGSKTAVLLGLLEAPMARLQAALPAPADGMVSAMFDLVERAYAVYAEDMDYYRAVYWGVMTSGDLALREGALAATRRVGHAMLQAAVDGRELRELDVPAVSAHLVAVFAGLLGMWAAGLVDGPGLRTHVLLSLRNTLEPHLAPALRKKVAALTA